MPSEPAAPRLRPAQSSPRTLLELQPDGSVLQREAMVVHAPGAEPPADWTATALARPQGWGRAC